MILIPIEEEMKTLISRCVFEVKVQHPQMKLFGKTVTQHRNIGFYSNESIGYKYSGYMVKSNPLTENLEKLLNKINVIFETTSENSFNAILINHYVNGEDYIGPHSDEEKFLSNLGVVCVAYGATRIFRVKRKQVPVKIFLTILITFCT